MTVAHGLTIITQLLLRLPCHILHRQRLHANELVIFYQLVRQLVLEVLTVVAQLRVRFGYGSLLLAIVTRTLHPTRQLTLLPPNRILQLVKPVRVVNLLTRRQREEVLNTHVDTNLAASFRLRLNIHVEQENQIVRLILTLHRPARQRFKRVADTVSPTDAHRPQFLG